MYPLEQQTLASSLRRFSLLCSLLSGVYSSVMSRKALIVDLL